ncbi:hypothetical protein EFQ99_07735 [Rhizobium vallis]|uniref:Uncharacterized protein n=1 Tax=Rhizobium vallis TaxID=634290 RepID=A0A3S0QX89_9HYPH|nr:hypothetical protein EFQ99_07735 [Rhizobium vallis]
MDISLLTTMLVIGALVFTLISGVVGKTAQTTADTGEGSGGDVGFEASDDGGCDGGGGDCGGGD